MSYEKGLFIVFEGVDRCGKTTQINRLQDKIYNNYQNIPILTTSEPWKDKEIEEMLQKDVTPYSHAEEMARLYIEDRKLHQQKIIMPILSQGGIVLCSRHRPSTDVYQVLQGVDPEFIHELHEKAGIIKPDLTYFLDINFGTARERIKRRDSLRKKFKTDFEFVEDVIKKYRFLLKETQENKPIYGKIITINANKRRGLVKQDIWEKFEEICAYWERFL